MSSKWTLIPLFALGLMWVAAHAIEPDPPRVTSDVTEKGSTAARSGVSDTRERAGQTAQNTATSPMKLDLSFVPEDAVIAFIIQARRILTGPKSEMYPAEVFGFIAKNIGCDPKELDQAMILLGLPDPTSKTDIPEPRFGAILRFKSSIDASDLFERIAPQAKAEVFEGRQGRIDRRPDCLCCVAADQKTVLISSTSGLRWMLSTKAGADSPLRKLLSKSDDSPEAQAFVAVQPIRSVLAPFVPQLEKQLPQKLSALARLPELVDTFTASAKETPEARMVIQMTATTANEETARELKLHVEQLLDAGRSLFQARMKSNPPRNPVIDPISTSDQIVAALQPKQIENRVEFRVDAASAPGLVMIGIAFNLPAWQAGREAVGRNVTQNNLKEIGLGMLNYESAHKQLPAQANYDSDGKALLSWRVHILPYLQEEKLYKQFHMDEPWNSENNKKLLDKMPITFADPRVNLEPGFTVYQGVAGPQCIFDGSGGGKAGQHYGWNCEHNLRC
jgi:Protein of unknown function (DUF1559)